MKKTNRLKTIVLLLVFLSAVLVGGCEPFFDAPRPTGNPSYPSATWQITLRPTARPSAGTDTSSRTTPPTSTAGAARPSGQTTASERETDVVENGRYTSAEDVSAYLRRFGRLPGNYISKRKAAELGWDSELGNLWKVTDRMSVGGDVFGNYERLLPEAKGRIWRECDINYRGGFRGPERLVYSNDGLIYYTADHYRTFRSMP